MEFLSQHVLPPTEHFLGLLQFISIMTYMIHLPFIGMVIGGVGAAMWFTLADSDNPNPRYEKFARDLLDVFLGSKTAVIVLGVLPIFALTFVLVQWFAGADATPLKYMPWTLVPVVLGFSALGLYRRSFASRKANIRAHLGMGSIGIVLLLAAYFTLVTILTRLQDPEKWFRATSLGIMMLNWNAIWRFLFFLHASFALTGCAILFFFFKWPGTRVKADDDYAGLVRNYGAGSAFAFSMALPVFYTFYIFTTADIAFDNTVYGLAVGLMLLILIITLLLFSNLRVPRTRFAATTFILFLGVFMMVSVVDQKTMGNANAEHRTLRVMEAHRVKAEREAELEALAAKGAGANRGEQIFTGQCMACHRFDSRLVGPPLAQVLPKYKDNVEELKAFVKNPSKKNPDYPPMPSLGLTDADVDAVVHYVLGQLEQRSE
jgi:cytochrome c